MNRADYEPLYREHYHRVVGLCRRMLGDATEAEDAAQEVFMRGYRAFGRYRDDEAFGPWINTIGSNYCIDLLRRRRRLAGVFSPAEAPDVASVESVDPTDTAVGVLISEFEAQQVVAAVEALPEKYRLPIVLSYYADASYDDIANTLGTTRNHVGVLLLRGKERLRRELANSAADERTELKKR